MVSVSSCAVRCSFILVSFSLILGVLSDQFQSIYPSTCNHLNLGHFSHSKAFHLTFTRRYSKTAKQSKHGGKQDNVPDFQL